MGDQQSVEDKIYSKQVSQPEIGPSIISDIKNALNVNSNLHIDQNRNQDLCDHGHSAVVQQCELPKSTFKKKLDIPHRGITIFIKPRA